MKHINMEEFANGAFTEQINRELKKVTENIQDPNTRCHGETPDYRGDRIQAERCT